MSAKKIPEHVQLLLLVLWFGKPVLVTVCNYFVQLGIRETEGVLLKVIVSEFFFFFYLLPLFCFCFQLVCAEDDGGVQGSESVRRGTAGTLGHPQPM